MPQQQMYPGIVNSPITEIAAAITAQSTTITLLNGNAVPDAPNLMTIGEGDIAETILYTGKSGNSLTGVTRGFQGTARSWQQNSRVARQYTEYDHAAFRNNIAEKARIIVSENPPPVSQREQGAFYFRVTDSIPTPVGSDKMRVSPNMGIKIKE